MTELCQGKMKENFKKFLTFFFLLSSVSPKTQIYFQNFLLYTSNSLQFDIYFVRVIFQTHIVMCS